MSGIQDPHRPSISSRKISSASQRSSASASFCCASASAGTSGRSVCGRARRVRRLRAARPVCRSRLCSAAIVFGSVSSACLSLKVRRFRSLGACRRRLRWLVSRLRRRLGRRTPKIGAALGQHVGIAAGIFLPAAVAFGHDHEADDAVEKIAIVADDEHGAGVIVQHFLAARRASRGRDRWSARRAPARWTASPARAPA